MNREEKVKALSDAAARLRELTTRLVSLDVLHGELQACAAAVEEVAHVIHTESSFLGLPLGRLGGPAATGGQS